MKKTLTVNLNNIVFHIDDDAYDMLQTYLSDIADHFKSDEERKEIMFDIEARIAELFTEKLQKNKNVINLSDVQEIVELMGKPSQYADEDEEPEKPKTDKKQHKTRRFYRDPENAILGGIASGAAAYFGFDVTIIRIILVALVLLSFGNVILLYILLWFIAPQAVTASQRLEMQGEDVTVESIKTELNNAKSYVQSDKFKQSATSIGGKFFEILQTFFKVIFGFVGGVLGLVGVIIVGILLFLLVFLVFEPTFFNDIAPGVFTNWSLITPENAILVFVSLILVIGCPVYYLVYWAIRLVSGRKSISHTTSIVVLILWLAGIFMFYSVGARTYINMAKNHSFPVFVNWADDAAFTDEIRSCDAFHSIDISGNIELLIVQDSVQSVEVSSPGRFLHNITTKVENGVLKIYTNNVFTNRAVKVRISADSIVSLVAKGASSIVSESQLYQSNLKIKLLGASSANLDVNVSGVLDVEVVGASKATLTGRAKMLNAKTVGASSIEAADLISDHVDVKAIGASDAQVFATKSVVADANGASNIDCKGNPSSVKQSEHIGSTISIE